MSVDLTVLKLLSAPPSLMEYGGLLTPALGGPVQRIDRLGTRWSVAVETPPMEMEPDGRKWSALITRAKKQGALIAYPLGDFNPGAPGAPVVAAATQSGTSVSLSGLTSNYAVRAGQPVSIVHLGRRYFDFVSEQVIAGAAGTATIVLQNLLRTPLSAGDVVELAKPKLEGWIDGVLTWPHDLSGVTAFTFSVSEAQ